MKNANRLIMFVPVGQIWMAAASSVGWGQEIGACCTCPLFPGVPGICTPDLTEAECDALEGWWIMGEGCYPNPCPGEPENNDCRNAIVVDLSDADVCVDVVNRTTSSTSCASDDDCPTDEKCKGKYYDFNNVCATDDFADLPTACVTGGDLHYDVWYVFTNEGMEEVDLWVSSCEEVGNDQMMADYAVGVADCVDLSTDDEVCCGNDSCGQVAGPAEMPNDEAHGCVEMVVAPGGSVLVRVGGWDTVDHTGNPKGDGRILFAIAEPRHLYSPIPYPWYPHHCRKNRMLSLLDNNPGAEVAMQVELIEIGKCCFGGTNHHLPCTGAGDCPGGTCGDCMECFYDYPYSSVGMEWWVSKPRCTDKDGHDVTATDPTCEGMSADDLNPVENIWRSQLTTGLVCHGGDNNDQACTQDADCPGGLCGKSIWPNGGADPADNCVHIGDCEIIPMATYALRTTFDPLVGQPIFSDDLIIGTILKPGTKCYGDIVGIWTGTQWTCPNGTVGMGDVMAAVFAFQHHPNMPHRTWAEVDDAGLNMVINIADIQQIVFGFKGQPYPFPVPANCPYGVSPPVE